MHYDGDITYKDPNVSRQLLIRQRKIMDGLETFPQDLRFQYLMVRGIKWSTLRLRKFRIIHILRRVVYMEGNPFKLR